ncbi:hypothetical protein ABLN64_14195 [Mycobacterium tuberculosis]
MKRFRVFRAPLRSRAHRQPDQVGQARVFSGVGGDEQLHRV